MTTLKNAIAKVGEDLLTQLAIQTEQTEVNIDDVIRDFEIRGEPFPHSLCTRDPLAILLALEACGDWHFSS